MACPKSPEKAKTLHGIVFWGAPCEKNTALHFRLKENVGLCRRKNSQGMRKTDCPVKRTVCFVLHNGIALGNQMIAKSERSDGRNCQQGIEGVSKKCACDKTTKICAFVGRKQLDKAIQKHRYHTDTSNSHRREIEKATHKAGQNPDKFPGASSTYWEFLSMIVERAIIPTVTPKKDGEPPIKPICDFSRQAGLHQRPK